jgi:hypothetical protein
MRGRSSTLRRKSSGLKVVTNCLSFPSAVNSTLTRGAADCGLAAVCARTSAQSWTSTRSDANSPDTAARKRRPDFFSVKIEVLLKGGSPTVRGMMNDE